MTLRSFFRSPSVDQLSPLSLSSVVAVVVAAAVLGSRLSVAFHIYAYYNTPPTRVDRVPGRIDPTQTACDHRACHWILLSDVIFSFETERDN